MVESCNKMKKEVGSIFPLSDSVIKMAESEQALYTDDRIYYSLCREALGDIAHALGETSKTVLIPAYTCQTVITPFEEAGWHCEYYSVCRDLRIDTNNLLGAVKMHHPSLVVAHPYFGMDLNDEEMRILTGIKEQGIAVVLDLTQCLFSIRQYSFASFVVASYRKWMPIPDGGYLKDMTGKVNICQPEAENGKFTDRELAAMYLRDQYFGNGEQRTKSISIRLSKSADHLADSNISPHKMSQVAYNLMQNEDIKLNQQRRYENYTYLYKNVRESDKVAKVCKNLDVVTTAPLYFTIFVQDRPSLQRLLAKDAIYAPVIWPVEDERVLINEEVKYIYDHILAIPIDQRYDESDMQRVVEIVNNY